VRKIWEGLKTVDRDSAIALLYAGVNLTVIEFFYLSSEVQMRINERDGTRRHSTSLEAGVTWAVATIVFFFIHMLPGDPEEILLGEQASVVSLEALRADLARQIRPLARLLEGKSPG